MRGAAAIWFALAGAWLRTAFVAAEPLLPPSALQPGVWEAHGFGRTREDAREDALHHAAEELQAKAAQRRPDLPLWKPSPAFVKSLRIDDGFEGESIDIPPIGFARRWIIRFRKVDDAALDRVVQREDRRAHAEERQRWSGFGLGAAAVMAAAALGLRRWRRRSPRTA